MNIEPLSLSHQRLVDQKLKPLKVSLSEYCFSSLYLFRKIHEYHLIHYQNELFIKGKTRDNMAFIMPTSMPTPLLLDQLKNIITNEIIFPIATNWLDHFENHLWQMNFKDEDSDYLCLASKFFTYAGHTLSKKRALINHLTESHEVETRPINTQQELDQARKILEEWQAKEIEKDNDYESCVESLEKFDALHLNGLIAYVDGQPKGFLIGEQMTHDCYVVHFGKADHAIKGLYQYLFQILAKSLPSSCQWLNLEQDLGIPSLREAKSSYQPSRYLRKWRLQLV
jgi:uncharacterized protein